MGTEIILSLAAAFCTGTSDFLAKLRPANRHVANSLLAMSLLGTISFMIYALWGGYNIFHFTNFYQLSMLAISGVANILALLCLYVGLARGPVAIAAPLVALSAVFLSAKWFILGITLSAMGYLACFIAISGAVILGVNFRKCEEYSTEHILVTAGFSVLAAFFFSLRLFIMQLITDDVHHSIVLTQARFCGLVFTLCIIAYYSFIKGQRILPSRSDFNLKNDLIIPTAQALIGAAGLIFLLIASVDEYRVIAPAIFCINAGFTVLWSCVFLNEKITLQRIIGFGILIIGIILLKIA